MATRAAKLALRGKALSDTGTEIGIVNNADATAITIDSNEKVGIGTASPTGNLSVNSSTVDSRITLTDSTTGANTSDGLLLQSGAANAYLWNYEAGNLIVGNNNAEAMRIDSSGYVQIGNTQASHVGTSQLFINRALNAAPATSGTAQTGGALRLRGGDNAVLDMGLNSVNTWIQATDRANLAHGYPLSLNPNGGTVGVGNSGASFTNQGMTYSNSWHEVVFGGTADPTNAITVQVDIAAKSTGQIFKVEAIFNHWNSDNSNYTVAKKVKYFWTYSSTTSIAEHNDGTTDRAGSSVGTWTVDKPSNTRLRVTKSAGANAWPGEWYVRITSSCPITKV